jgi:hypothetical protein
MKKSQALLLKLAAKFQDKYAQSQDLQEIIQNAASYGESSANGIMNFPAQLKKDQADMNINVTITSATLGGLNVDVSQPAVEPSKFAANYAKLPAQIKKYLDKHISSFPQVPHEKNNHSIICWQDP